MIPDCIQMISRPVFRPGGFFCAKGYMKCNEEVGV